MSTLNATNIADSSGNFPSNASQIQQGRAKAWSNLNGQGTIAPRDDFNISSYIDNGTGNYTNNFATAMVSANFSPSGITTASTPGDGNTGIAQVGLGVQTSSTVNYWTSFSSNSGQFDPNGVMNQINGD